MQPSRAHAAAHLVDQESLAYMRAMAALGPLDYTELSARSVRQSTRAESWQPPPGARRLVLRKPTANSPGCEAVLYTPRPAHTKAAPGLLLYLHGGGFVMGDVAAADPICRRLVTDARCYVLSLEYRLAPEAPFPAALEDALCALDWAHAHAAARGWSAHRLAIAGQSAGGNLAAAAAQRWRDCDRSPLRLQLLVCPLLDFRPERHASRRELADNPVLSQAAIAWFEERYLPHDEDRDDPRASPLACSDLAGVAPAHVIVAAADPLRDEGEAYARALMRADVPVLLERYPSVHGFMSLHAELRQGALALESCARSVRAALAPAARV